MAYSAITSAEIAAGKPVCGPTGFGTKTKDNFDYLYGVVGTLSSNQVLNGSFEVDSNADGDPDNWTKSLYTGGTGTLYTTAPGHGAKAMSFTHPGGASNGGGYMDSDYIEVSDLREYWIAFIHWATAAGMKNQVQIRYFDRAKTDLVADATLYSSTTNPTSEAAYSYFFTPPATARFIKVRIIGGFTDTDVAGTAYFDDVRINYNPVLMINEGKIGAQAVAQAKLKTSLGEIDTTDFLNEVLPGGQYGFYPQVKHSAAGSVSARMASEVTSASYITNIYYGPDISGSAYAQQRYVTASGEIHWIFILIERGTGNRLAGYQAPDHPCFGNRGIVHPFLDYDPTRHEIIVINPSLDIIKSTEIARLEPDYLKPEKSFTEQFNELYDIDEAKEADWPDIPITVGLPKVHNGKIVDDWRFMTPGTLIQPVKQVIQIPDFITPLGIKLKS